MSMMNDDTRLRLESMVYSGHQDHTLELGVGTIWPCEVPTSQHTKIELLGVGNAIHSSCTSPMSHSEYDE